MTAVDLSLRLDDQLCFALYAASHAMTRAYKPHLHRLHLTYPQYIVLLVLWEGDDLTVKELGGRLGLDSGTLTPLLKRLEGVGYVMRRRDPKDERQVRLTLTAEGKALEAEARNIPHMIACATGLSHEELRALRDLLTALGRKLDQPNAGEASV